MMIRSYNPIERGPAIWLDQLIDHSGAQCSRLLRQLREYPDGNDPIDIVIAGGGGNCRTGLELYTALREWPRRVRVTVFDAPSMSGLIAMAGDVVRIVETGTIFLHPVGYSSDYLLNGPPRHMPAAALKALAKQCEATDALHIQIFARRTGLDPARIYDLRAAETTLDAQRAVELGFADEIVQWPRSANPSAPGGEHG